MIFLYICVSFHIYLFVCFFFHYRYFCFMYIYFFSLTFLSYTMLSTIVYLNVLISFVISAFNLFSFVSFHLYFNFRQFHFCYVNFISIAIFFHQSSSYTFKITFIYFNFYLAIFYLLFLLFSPRYPFWLNIRRIFFCIYYHDFRFILISISFSFIYSLFLLLLLPLCLVSIPFGLTSGSVSFIQLSLLLGCLYFNFLQCHICFVSFNHHHFHLVIIPSGLTLPSVSSSLQQTPVPRILCFIYFHYFCLVLSSLLA